MDAAARRKSNVAGGGGGLFDVKTGGGAGGGAAAAGGGAAVPGVGRGQTPVALPHWQKPQLVATNCTSCRRTLMAPPSQSSLARLTGGGGGAGGDPNGDGEPVSPDPMDARGVEGDGDGGDDDFFFIPKASKKRETSNLDRQSTQMTILSEIVHNKCEFDDMICDHCASQLSKEFKALDAQYRAETAALHAALGTVDRDLSALPPKHWCVPLRGGGKAAATLLPHDSPANSVVALHPAPAAPATAAAAADVSGAPTSLYCGRVTDEMLADDARAEQRLLAALTAVHTERQRIRAELADIAAENARVDAVERDFWPVCQDFEFDLNAFRRSDDALCSRVSYAEGELSRLKHTHVALDAFHIFTDETGKVGTINGLRLGMLLPGELPPPRGPVEWPELSAALGQCVLLVDTIAKKLDLTFAAYRLVPLSSFSRVDALAAQHGGAASAAAGKAHHKTPEGSGAGGGAGGGGSSMEVHWAGDLSRFNAGLVRLLCCVRELAEKLGLPKLREYKPIVASGHLIGGQPIQLASVTPCVLYPHHPPGPPAPAAAGHVTTPATATGNLSTKSADGGGRGAATGAAGAGASAHGRARSSSAASVHAAALAAAAAVAQPVVPPDHTSKCGGCAARKVWSRALKYVLIDLKLALVYCSKMLAHKDKFR